MRRERTVTEIVSRVTSRAPVLRLGALYRGGRLAACVDNGRSATHRYYREVLSSMRIQSFLPARTSPGGCRLYCRAHRSSNAMPASVAAVAALALSWL